MIYSKKNPFSAKVVKVIGNESVFFSFFFGAPPTPYFTFLCFKSYAADYDINQSYSTSLYCSRRNLFFA